MIFEPEVSRPRVTKPEEVGHQWREKMAADGENSMAIDKRARLTTIVDWVTNAGTREKALRWGEAVSPYLDWVSS